MNIRFTPRQRLEVARNCHMLAKEGMSRRGIQRELKISNDTVYRYLAIPCPTEDEITAAPDEYPSGKETDGGLKTIRTYLSPAEMERLKSTSDEAKPNLSDLTRQAIRFWVDALEHINSDDTTPVKLCGVKVRFERKVP